MLKSDFKGQPNPSKVMWACNDKGDVVWFDDRETCNNEFPTQFNVFIIIVGDRVHLSNYGQSITASNSVDDDIDSMVIAFTTMLETLEELQN